MINLHHPLQSLQEGHWFKLICGASYHHLPAIRTLVLSYALAGADCIDVAADPAVILAAREAIATANEIARTRWDDSCQPIPNPWLMVSLSDGDDPHFRKATFDPQHCPADCPRPCVTICPAGAIQMQVNDPSQVAVITDRCYGCGRCLPICPSQHITTQSHRSTPETLLQLVLDGQIDAIELHTQVGHEAAFERLWQTIAPWIVHLKLLAISCPDGEGWLDYLRTLHQIVAPLPCPLIWQLDGRPMSGDIGVGATRSAIKLGQKAIAAKLPGYLQLAGGTNHHTVPKLRQLGLFGNCRQPLANGSASGISGVAYGSYARTLLAPVVEMEDFSDADFTYHLSSTVHQETKQTLLLAKEDSESNALIGLEPLQQAIALAASLVSQLKPYSASYFSNSLELAALAGLSVVSG